MREGEQRRSISSEVGEMESRSKRRVGEKRYVEQG